MTTEEFESLSKNEKKVLIAKDVIHQIECFRYKPFTGVYAEIPYMTGDIKSQFEKIENCPVCAIGACILSLTKYANNLNFEDLSGLSIFSHNTTGRGKVVKLMLSVFTKEELAYIEAIFETGDVVFSTLIDPNFDLEENEKEKCINIGMNLSSKENLLLIMQNIIDNNGVIAI